MNILLIGGNGFIGNNLINYIFLKKLKINIINLDIEETYKPITNIDNRFNKYSFIRVNIKDYDKLENIVKKNTVTHVIYLASKSYDKTIENLIDYNDNILGLQNILHIINKINKKIVFLYYGINLNITDINDPYYVLRNFEESYLKSYLKFFGLKYFVIKSYNVYGNNPDFILEFIKDINNNKKIIINNFELLKFIHINDICSGILKILNIGSFGETYYLTNDEDKNNKKIEIVKYILNKLGKNDYNNYIEINSLDNNLNFNNKINNKKIKLLGWNTTINITNIIDKNLELKFNELKNDYGFIINSSTEKLCLKLCQKLESILILR